MTMFCTIGFQTKAFFYLCDSFYIHTHSTIMSTLNQYNAQLAICRDTFVKKTKDYGTSWRIFRPTSLTDQLFIKAKRIRTLEEVGEQKIADDITGEYRAIVNYCIMAMIQVELPADAPVELGAQVATDLYDKHANETRDLMMAKNHDYGEAWREMRISSLTDMILSKLLRVKQIEDNQGQTLVSEGVVANYQDMMNYALFALIRMHE